VRSLPACLRYPGATLLVIMVSLVAGCAAEQHSAACNCHSDTAKQSGPKTAAELNSQRQILSEGYSLLYHDASSLNFTQLVLYGKKESDAVAEIVTAVAEYGGQLEKELERIDKDYPGVRIDLDPLPEMEKRKRSAIARDRVIEYVPMIGRSGREYERTLLISLLNGINHERHLCSVMAEEEPDPNLKKFLLDTKTHYDGFYKRIDALLNQSYYK
jgi:hypothetical protein